MSSGPSKVIVLDPDPRAGRQVQLGFEREGVPTCVPTIQPEPAALALEGLDPGVVLVGGEGADALALVRRARAWLTGANAGVPIVFVGRGVARRDAEAAGADEVLARPAYLRDVVTIGRLLRGIPASQRDHLVGNLVETTGVLTLVRALAALGRSAVLTLIRGLRRGEVRFYRGEVTSAQVGLIHGQAALHQLLLWTDARFDYAHEDIVRRQQIPLSFDELFVDAEQFLEGVREHAGELSPAMVLEQNAARVQSLGKQIPTEVYGVLRMFDGHRVLADVLEDSPYRVFETLRVARKAVEAGLLRRVESQRPKATWRAVLAIEEWLVGNETREAVVERTAALDSGPVKAPRKGKRKRRHKRMKALAPHEAKPEIDWGALVPRVIGVEVGQLSGVVPAQATHGEVELPTRNRPREGLEALMDTDKRQRIFPTDIGLEPKVVVASEAGEWDRAKQAAEAQAVAEAKAATEGAVPERAPEIETQPAKKLVRGSAVPSPDGAVTDAVAAGVADTPPAGMSAAEITRAASASLPATPPGADAIDPATAALVAVPRYLGEMTSDPVAAVTSVPDTAAEPREIRPGATDAKQLVRALVADAVPASDGGAAASGAGGTASASGPAPHAAGDGASAAATRPTRAHDDAVTTPFIRPNAGEAATGEAANSASTPSAATAPSADAFVAAPITIAEGRATSVAVADVVTVSGSPDTAVVTASPRFLISEQPGTTPIASTEPARTVTSPPAEPSPAPSPAPSDDAAVTRGEDAAPQEADDEPSDGVVRAVMATPDTARLARAARMAPPKPEHDGPPIKETTGEIREKPRAEREPVLSEPSILVADLGAVHDAVAAAVGKPDDAAASAPPPGDAASAARELEVSEVRRDAVAFTEAEEAFFRGADQSSAVARSFEPETFEDLDEGYQPPKFWDRVFGRKPKKPR